MLQNARCSSFELKFINTAPGAPLPDLIQLFNLPEPGQELTFIDFEGEARGPLPDGTPGLAKVKQIALLDENGNLIFAVETVTLEVVGGEDDDD